MIEMIAIFIVILILIGVFFYKKYNELQKYKLQYVLLSQENQNNQNKIDELKDELHHQKTLTNKNIEQSNDYKSQISSLQTKLNEQSINMQDRLDDLKDNEKNLKQEFKNLATEIFDNNSKKFSEQNKESLGLILNPMKQQLNEFKQKVEEVHSKDTMARGELKNELKTLKELNLKIGTDAINLTNALKGQSKQQGVWGEMVLEKVLESSGLRLGHEYNREVSLKDENSTTYRPDVIVNLPDNRHIIIDAKTSLNAYNEYIQAEDLEKPIFIKKHLLAIKEHIKTLSNKKYENLKDINSLDFVFMFVPIEASLLLALENDINLYDEAFKQKIILVSPTTLLVALRAVENTWRYEKQAQSIADVAKRAEQLYTKFTNFVLDIQKVGDSLNKANSCYDDAYKKLTSGDGNLIWQATQLKEVSNIKPKKELPSALTNSL